MVPLRLICPTLVFGTLLVSMLTGAGCAHQAAVFPISPDAPKELSKMTLPEYVIEPPDILQIDALYVVPLPPYRIKPLDVLAVRAQKALVDEPIAGLFSVDPDGTINMGLSYGTVKVAALTIAEAKTAVEKHLATLLKDPRVDVALAESRGVQQIRGPHLVRPDGTVSLGIYGNVMVTGLTLSAAKKAIEVQLSFHLQSPEITVDVVAYNSKVLYVVYDGGGSGQQIYRLPITGNETVLDAVSQLNGLSPVADTNKIWVARPTIGCAPDLILPVDWCGITARGRGETNYQLLPGDRIYVQADRLVTVDTRLARILAPIERLFGITLLGSSTYHSITNKNGTTGP